MKAGQVPTGVLHAQALPSSQPVPHHCDEATYTDFLLSQHLNPIWYRRKLDRRRRFVERWPELRDWFTAPLAERVGRRYGESTSNLTYRVSFEARPYVLFLALRGYVDLDYPWLLAVDHLFVVNFAKQLGIDFGIGPLTREAIGLGFSPISSDRAMRWGVCRIALHTGDLDPRHIRQRHIDELLQAVREFSVRADVTDFYATFDRYRWLSSHSWTTLLHLLQVVLYHRGQVPAPPRRVMPCFAAPAPALPAMQAVIDRWLAARKLTDRPSTLQRLEVALRHFLIWLAKAQPDITRFADVTRDHLLAYLAVLAEEPTERTEQPLAPISRRGRISALSVFFRDTTTWGWAEVPTRPLLTAVDMPRLPKRVPRFIPGDELDRLMSAVAELPCDYQRAAILVARWSGARQNEIIRLGVDCLDSYPDGTPRLRLPAGKTYRERLVPIHQEAAAALREVMAERTGRSERALIDEVTGLPTRYLFMMRGKLLGKTYLFETPLRKACEVAGLIDAAGHPTVHTHRFRHTVGTQLAERGAKLHTIMSVLGHRSVSMALVYAQISDPEVLKDYRAVLGPGAVLAGPGAEALRNGKLSTSAIDWLKCNFFKTELELGHCLRLPAEGPCECDLYLNCAKFVTTPAYAPRLRERRQVEFALAEDAQAREWPRERERHLAVVTRIEQLLTDLGEPLEDSANSALE